MKDVFACKTTFWHQFVPCCFGCCSAVVQYWSCYLSLQHVTHKESCHHAQLMKANRWHWQPLSIQYLNHSSLIFRNSYNHTSLKGTYLEWMSIKIIQLKVDCKLKETLNVNSLKLVHTKWCLQQALHSLLWLLLADPYVKVWLQFGDKRIEKRKTPIFKCTLNPIFNETFSFNVPWEKIRECSLDVMVMDFDNIGRNELIGRILLAGEWC